ncbi:MAG: helix-turn-helix domain-containing protein [Candidatus Acidiferrum sp.]
MYLAGRIRLMREAKHLSQGDIEKRTGLLRCYISRVENGHTVPAIETLEKIARSLEVPLYQLFYEGDNLPEPLVLPDNKEKDWTSHGRGHRLFVKLRMALSRTNEADRRLLLHLAKKMSNGRRW